MFEDEITGSLDELVVDPKEKNQFIAFCKTYMDKLESMKGKASTAKMKIEDNLYEQYELIKRRKKLDGTTEERASKKIDAINIKSHLKDRLKDKFTKGEINSYHIQDLLKTGLDEELGKLDSDAQEVIIERIKNNRNKINLMNSEEIAAFNVQLDSPSRKSLDFWYQGMMVALHRVRSLSNPSDKSLEELYLEQKEGLTVEIAETLKSLNILASRIKLLS
ncbi:hypothetical protein [Desulfosporosinus sp. FKA]|uniref:hypothetical protein n=1 Tax=Desulfosporosinus sp. FKA TaxID=1969834 RepID=UPI000B4A29F3|nr:hypothetical protein [Desulfosporosinus sp. FKA]